MVTMQYRKVEDIAKLEGNPRKIDKEDMARLKQSIEGLPDYFEAHPIVLSDRTGKLVVIDGNQRLEAARQLGWEEIPTALLSGLTEEKEREIIIRANVNNGEWDMDLLQEWDKEQLEDWGVSVDWEDPEEQKEAEEDDFTEEDAEKAEARVKPGEVWKLGEHRLMCGDSTDADCVAKLMNGEKADMVFTDPPYGVSYTDKNEYLNSLGKPMSCPKAIENDSMKPKDMYDFWCKAFKLLHEHTSDKMSYYITAPQGGDLLLLLLQAVRDSGFMLKHQLIWNKNNHVLGRCDYNYKHEPIIYGWKIGGTHTFYGNGKFKTSVWDIPKPLKNDLHPTMKPIELVSECLLNNTKENDRVLDLFGGSGTSLISSEQLNRKCFMMEYDPHYCDVIIARWEKLTGKQAERIEE